MSDGADPQRDRPSLLKRNPWLYLLVALPIPAAISWNLFKAAVISPCGFSGCIRGAQPNIGSVAGFLIGAVIVLAVPIALVAWHPRESLRVKVSLLASATVVGISWAVLHL